KENASIALIVQATDLRLISRKVKLPIFAQHLDPVKPGSNTGLILPEAVKQAGAVGTILNHAENKRDNEFLQKAIARAKEVGLEVLVCAESIERAKQIAAFPLKPDFIAVEPPELIGGDISVSTANPEIIKGTVQAVQGLALIPVLAGAGVKTGIDVRKSIELGAAGVLLASGVVKAPKPKKALLGLVKGLK
ncbi:triose-phosphate isomerase, partial [archaeon]|nr:triose-phosphate isomerase [archaeon]